MATLMIKVGALVLRTLAKPLASNFTVGLMPKALGCAHEHIGANVSTFVCRIMS